MSVIDQRKTAARRRAKIVQAGCDPAVGAVMALHVLGDAALSKGMTVGGFWPLAAEIDTRPLLHGLVARGCAVALPETPAQCGALVFRAWQPGDVLAAGRFGTMQSSRATVRPDFLLVPLLAFDARGNRLGHGGGFYDRTIAALPDVFRLGCGFAAQEIDQVPVTATDMALHAVATELGVRRF